MRGTEAQSSIEVDQIVAALGADDHGVAVEILLALASKSMQQNIQPIKSYADEFVRTCARGDDPAQRHRRACCLPREEQQQHDRASSHQSYRIRYKISTISSLLTDESGIENIRNTMLKHIGGLMASLSGAKPGPASDVLSALIAQGTHLLLKLGEFHADKFAEDTRNMVYAQVGTLIHMLSSRNAAPAARLLEEFFPYGNLLLYDQTVSPLT